MSNVDSPPALDPHSGPIYHEVVGTLQWLAICTRADIAHAAQALARFNTNPGEEHWKQANRCLRYLKGTIDHGITYTRQSDPTLAHSMYGFCDADWSADPDTHLGASQHDATPLRYEDNNAQCILLSENPSHKGRVQHIDLRIHALLEHVRDGPTADMSADVLTKALPSLRTLLTHTCSRIDDVRDILCYYTVSIPLQRLRPCSEGG